MHVPAPPPLKVYAAGGASKGDGVDCLLAGGEFIVPPHVVRILGGGDMKRGHRILDAFVVTQRKKIIAQMKKLPGPKR